MLFNLKHLHAAIEIQRLGSITLTAETIHLSQSAVTQGLNKLEAVLGFELFTRSHAGLSATSEGIIFLKRAARAIRFLIDARSLLGHTYRDNPLFLHLMTTGQLRAVKTVVERGSYTRAAEQLNLSQPTVYRAVKDMERLTQKPLFSKSEHGVSPSVHAKRLARQISLFFNEITQGIDEVNNHRGRPGGNLRIGSLPLSRTTIVPSAVVAVTETFPSAKVSIIEGPYREQLDGLLNGQIDMIVGALRSSDTDSDIAQQSLFEDELSIVMKCGHALDNEDEISAKALQKLAWVAPRQGTPARQAFTAFFSRHNLPEPSEIVESSSLVATRGLLLESDRVALLSSRQVEIEVRHHLLSVKGQRLEGTQRKIGITFRKSWRPTMLQQAFISLLKQNTAQLSR